MEDHQDRYGRQDSGSHLTPNSPERKERIRQAMAYNNLDLLVCALPSHVVMMSGYWPVVGTGVALAYGDGRIVLLVPADEAELTGSGWADEVHTFRPASLRNLQTPSEAIEKPLKSLMPSAHARVGYEAGTVSEPASYAAMHLYGGGMAHLLARCSPHCTLVKADDVLSELSAGKSGVEIERIRTACQIARVAFEALGESIHAGNSEIAIAHLLRGGLSGHASKFPQVRRCDGFAWCMSGPNSALAFGAYARSRTREIEEGDLVLVHCNSYADGYWTDITRTWCAGPPDERKKDIFRAVFAARDSALRAVRPGAPAAAVDEAARRTMTEHGFGAEFKHSAGHGIGFEAINVQARPRLHPASPDVLEPGMIFNLEPAAYFEGYGGVRHCDVVVVTEERCELLTPFLCSKEWN
jgi:Xaa-Pro aminopeptidase